MFTIHFKFSHFKPYRFFAFPYLTLKKSISLH